MVQRSSRTLDGRDFVTIIKNIRCGKFLEKCPIFPSRKKWPNLIQRLYHEILITLIEYLLRICNKFSHRKQFKFIFSILYHSGKYLKNFRELGSSAIIRWKENFATIISPIIITFPRNIQVFPKIESGPLSRGCLLSSRLIRVSRYEYCPVNDMFECYSEMRTTMAGVNANVH